jgi:hypothetical protein
MKSPPSVRKSRKTGHRLRGMYRLIELSIILRQREYSQSELTALYKVDRKTIVTDMEVIAEYYPLREEKRGKFHYYSIPADAEPVLKKIGAKREKK